MSARSGTDEIEVIRQKAMMDEVVRKAGKRTESRELQLERENASLREQLRLANERADAAEIKSAHLQKRLDVAHESIAFAHDRMAEQVRQARWEVAEEAKGELRLWGESGAMRYLSRVSDANAPKD